MKRTLLPLLAAVFFFGSCKKDNDKKDFIQLQKIENGEEAFNFQYNEQHQLSRYEVLRTFEDGGTPTLYRYAIISYENNIPVSADLYRKGETTDFYRRSQVLLHYNSQNRIAYTVKKYYNENGTYQEGNNDTVDYAFNADSRLASIKYRGDNSPWTFSYDAQGNIKLDPQTYSEPNYTDQSSYEFKYDNGVNPLSVNGVGLTIFALYEDDDFEINQLLSVNNATYNKTVYTYTYKNGETTNVDKYTDIYQFANTYDENGGLKEVGVTYNFEYSRNGSVEDTQNSQRTAKITCVKKQY
ncbi:MAG: hypothetical protein ACTHMC_25900 [Pseudobacter sp.]|uniref:hypothetical protein n=1 Tax=Pseudobacter sp. TaxID=2045420 RepID=UPI003F7D399E